MKIAGINFPEALINALHDGELVIFAGAGVSMGEPARLPNFKYLAKTIAEGTGETLRAGEEIDHFLGRLQDGKVKVHERAAEELDQDNLKSTELHRNLLRLYPSVEKVRIVTTNFDLLFEQAAKEIFDDQPEVFRAPALTLGRQFRGIVHVHGTVSRHTEMVITDADFGRAYLNEGWAQRFLVELFSNFTILFVGYSYDDTIMSYLTRALPPRATDRHFALTQETNFDAQGWHLLEIEPITYPQPSENDHSILDEGVRRLADLIRRGAVDWHREITEIAENPPSLDEETEDLIEYALGDDTRTRFFTEAATAPEWLDWLDEHGYLNPLFSNGTFSECDKRWSWWLAEQFAYNHADKLFLLIGKHNMHLHPHFWHDLAYQIGVNRENPWDKESLARWISLLLNTVQEHINVDEQANVGIGTLLHLLGERCIQHDILDSLLQIFDAMMGNRIQLKEGFSWPNDDESNESPPVDVELLLIGSEHVLNQLWKEGLKPRRSQVAETLLNRVIKRLEERYITLCTWQKANRNWDPESDRRSAIESHEQNVFSDAIDVLIDAARDCLEWLTSHQVDAAARWCDQLVCSDAPLLRRLGVHGLSKRKDLTIDSKIDWLLRHVDLHELSTRHEVFRVVGIIYPQASQERRENFIETVWAYRWPDEEHPAEREYTARQHFDWFDWLHQSDSNCALVEQALVEVSTEYPDFESREHPDLLHWMSLNWEGLQTSWTPEQLLANPASHWLDDLLSFQVAEGEESNRGTLLNRVAEAATQNFDWGLDLANVLGETETWDTDLWSTLIHAWSRMELDESKYSKVLSWLGKAELHPKHNRETASALYTLLRKSGPSYALNLLPQANKIAANLWCHLNPIEPTEEIDDWHRFAINYPAWDLANFWLYGFSLWQEQQDPRPTVLSDECREALSGIMEDRSLSGKLGRTVLASQFAFLLTVDERWTQDNLLPLFDPNSDDFQAVWDGFLARGRLNPAVVEAMRSPFLKVVEQINGNLFNRRSRFIKYYIYMFEYLDEDLLDEWIPKFFQYASQEMPSTTEVPRLFSRSIPETKDLFAAEVGSRLRKMTETEQQEWWQRWLKRYWENRLQGVLAALEEGEIAWMLNWLPHLTSVFPEAVDIAVQMTVGSLQGCYVIEELSISDENDLWQKYPESVVKLLIYLWECDLPRHSWYSGRALIDNLLSSNISSQLKGELEEIKVQL